MTAAEAHRALLSLPPGPASTISAPAVILAPHADDESLGCGGLIATLVAAGQAPFVLFVTDGVGSHPNSLIFPPTRLQAVREQEAVAACAILGLPRANVGFLHLPDTAAPMEGPAFDNVVRAIVVRCRAVGASALLAPWEHDPHIDHVATHRMAAAAATSMPVEHWAYPVWGWTLPPEHTLPDTRYDGFRLDITRQLPTKRRAIAAHRSQLGTLILDDPAGFVLPATLLHLFDQPFETFIRLT